MQNINQAIQAGYAAYKRGEHALARRHLAAVDHPKAIHLLGLVEKDAGNLETAAELLDRAALADPADHEVARNQGLVAVRRGDLAAAESAFGRALALKPDFSQASISLGRLLIDLERWEEARQLYEQLGRAAPNSVPGRYGLGTVRLGQGAAEEAEQIFDELIDAGHDRPEIRFMRARARLELGRTGAALDDLWQSHRNGPSVFSLKTLAGTLWMEGQRDAFDELLRDAAAPGELTVPAAEILRQSGAPEAALGAIAGAESSFDLPPESDSVVALAHIDLGDAPAAEIAAEKCLAAEPNHRAARASLITALLMQGEADRALEHIGRMRRADPDGQHWIAYESTALRLKGSGEYERLVDLERFVRPYTLPVPAGFDDLASFNTQLLQALDHWHVHKARPLDQSLRGGRQTPRDLRFIDDPVIQAFIAALDAPIRQYMEDTGSGGDHPLTRRNSGRYRIAGSWSVRLEGGGRHVNHVHPEGWISSSYYVSVPEETLSGDNRDGWIKFGEPPFETVPPCPPQKWVQPKPGLLVLFPSFLWHGTEPIQDGSVRVTAPFDAVPD